MTSSTRASSFLPTIKCSSCGVEIPISMMGDHVCAPIPPLPESRTRIVEGPFAPSTLGYSNVSIPQHHAPPPGLNPAATFDSFLRKDQSLPPSNLAGNVQIAPPAKLGNGRRSPFKTPFRSLTTPMPLRPPSPELAIPQDSAFPPFPTPRSRSATPTTPLSPTFAFQSTNSQSHERPDLDMKYPLTNSQPAADNKVMHGVENIAPNPFNFDQGDEERSLGHKKTLSMSNSGDFVHLSRSESTRSHVQRPSTSSSNYTRNPSISSTAGSNRFTIDQSDPQIPTVPPPPHFMQQEESETVASRGQNPRPAFDFGAFGQDHSQSLPQGDESDTQNNSRAPYQRTSPDPSFRSHKPRPSIAAAAMQPLHEIGSTSSFKLSRSMRGRNASSDRTSAVRSKSLGRHESRDDMRLEDAPPVPMPAQVLNLGKDAYHTPHESTSSNESYSSWTKSGSSRSTPPLNESPQRPSGYAATKRQDNDLFHEFEFGVDHQPIVEESQAHQEHERKQPKPRLTDIPVVGRPIKPTVVPKEKTTLQRTSPISSPDDYMVSPFDTQSRSLRVSPAPLVRPPLSTSPSGRPRTANKGNCRGCEEAIVGKSVSSADGRLTGRYHKRCFVCKTCQAPFETADFYVMNNHPYCGRHYHELNDSLCKNCDRGIEGQYLETDVKQKFHPYCFSCQECHRILRDDYFVWHGRNLCEQHAFRAAQQPSSLGPGRRYPERRTTRLMMM